MADRGQIKGGILDGPLAFDNAVSIVAAKTKGIKSAVAGRADILVVPDLEAGNMLAKQLEYLADAQAAAIVLGASVPIVLTSQGMGASAYTPAAGGKARQAPDLWATRADAQVTQTPVTFVHAKEVWFSTPVQ